MISETIVAPPPSDIDIIEKSSSTEIDRMEALIGAGQQIDCPIVNRFTNGLYTREIFMPKFAMVCSKIHKTQHQFIVSKGMVSVWCKDKGWTTFKAPYHGITEPGTRRFLYNHEDTVWTTFHPNPDNTEDMGKIADMLWLKHELSTLEDFGGSIETLLTTTPEIPSNTLMEETVETSL